MDKNFEWVSSLKVGDEIAVDNSTHWYKNNFSVNKVVKITPTGRIRLDDGTQYYPDGRKVGDSFYRPLRQITPEILNIVERRRLMSELDFDKFKGLLSVERLKILLEWQEELTRKD